MKLMQLLTYLLVCLFTGNVVWLDKASPARALLGVSHPISGLTQTGKRELEEVVLVQEDEDSDEEDMADTSINTIQPVAEDTTQAMQTSTAQV
jgi:hypothetical protein